MTWTDDLPEVNEWKENERWRKVGKANRKGKAPVVILGEQQYKNAVKNGFKNDGKKKKGNK